MESMDGAPPMERRAAVLLVLDVLVRAFFCSKFFWFYGSKN
jgi:hypothetical protein